MITYKSVRNGKEKVVQIKDANMALVHFQLFIKSKKIKDHIKGKIVSVTKNDVVIQEDNSLLGTEEGTYSGDEKEMSVIVALASEILYQENLLEKKKMSEVSGK